MKLNDIEQKRLAELKAKSADTLTVADKTELAALEAKAAGGESVSTDEAKSLIVEAVKTALASAPKGLDEAGVKTIVETAIKGLNFDTAIDKAKLAAELATSIKGSFVTGEQVKGYIEEGLKNFRTESKMLHDTGTGDVTLPVSHRKGNLSVAMKQLLNVLTKKDINAEIPESLMKETDQKCAAMEDRIVRYGVKALTATTGGSGLELLPVGLSGVLLQRLYLKSLLAQGLMAQEIQMPSNPYKLPLMTTRPTFRKGSERTIANESSPGTASPTLTAQKLIGMTEFDYEADEDSLIPVLPMVTSQLGDAAADAFEDAVINGDTAGTQDTGFASDDVKLCFDGLRKLVLAQGSTLAINLATGGISVQNFGAVKKALGKWGVDPSSLLFVLGTNGYNDAILLPETLTAEKAGGANRATIFTGVQPNILGVDIIPSARVREDLNASGVYDAATVTKGNFMLLYRPAWLTGVRRGFTVELFRDIKAQTTFVVASFRRAFAPMESLANTKGAAMGYSYSS